MTVHHAITWAHMLALEHGGHDKFLPALSNPELRFTMASIREHFRIDAALLDRFLELERDNETAAATLERVRVVLNSETPANLLRMNVLAALAGQPEAPKGREPTPEQAQDILRRMADDELAKVRTENGLLASRLADYQTMIDDLEPHDALIHWRQDRADLAAANARIAELEVAERLARATANAKTEALRQTDVALDAANARIAELEESNDCFERSSAQSLLDFEQCMSSRMIIETALNTANARADAAERRLEDVRQMRDAAEAQYGAQIVGLRDERDQLAARVKELESEVEALTHHREFLLNDRSGLRLKLQEANARAVEWERLADERHRDILELTTDNTKHRRAAEDANALADAAERGRQTMVRAALDAEEQRDQLAARVKELELINAKLNEYRVRAGVCTPEERRVLGVCAAMRLCDDDPDADPLEPQELGEDCYIYTDDQGAIARAELANRAAKANRGGT